MPHSVKDHFQGKTVPEHLKEARIKGAKAVAEIHGTEISGKASAFADSLKDTSLVLALLWFLLTPLLPEKQKTTFFILFIVGWILWKIARSACLGWARLLRLHRLIEEERWEIQHHREQEREELTAIYAAKGFEGELLTQVIDVLMADDNRLLEIMLDEELGVPLEAYEHPLEQAFGAFLGTLFAAAFGFAGYFFLPSFGPLITLCFIFLMSGVFVAKIEKIAPIPSFIWNVAIFGFSLASVYFLRQYFIA
jgi:hypothetical protein